GAGSLNHVNVSIVDRRGKSNTPFAQRLFDARREGQFGFELRSFQGGSGQLDYRKRLERHGAPAVLSINGGNAVAILRVNDGGSCHGRFREVFKECGTSFRPLTKAG